jgi:hypothetical protein
MPLPRNSMRQPGVQIEESGEIFRVGDDVYYVIDGPEYDKLLPNDESEDEDESKEMLCAKCGKGERRGKSLTECDYCLRPFHAECGENEPVEGDPWRCPFCEQGKPPPDDPPKCKSDLFLRTEEVLGIGRITRLMRCSKEGPCVEVLDYQRPKQEKGPQQYIARRLHFTTYRREFPAEHLLKHVMVARSRNEYEAADTNNVFLCETKKSAESGNCKRLHSHSEVLHAFAMHVAR